MNTIATARDMDADLKESVSLKAPPPHQGAKWNVCKGMGTYRPPIDVVCPACGTKHVGQSACCSPCKAGLDSGDGR